MGKVEPWQLAQRQALPLEMKVKMTENRIRSYYDHFNGDVAVSFSGGKDSTVLLHIARQLYPNIKAVFVDTGLEYPEIRSFVKSQDNVETIRPTMTFKEVLDKYGFPLISKENAQKIYEIRTTKSDKLMDIRLYGKGPKKAGMLPVKYRYLCAAPFNISHKCCEYLKKKPSREIEKRYAIITGEMAFDSSLRKTDYLRHGCMGFNGNIFCKPMTFWTDKDVWEYIKIHSVAYSDIYKMGYRRTGCMFCMFGVHLEKEPNRFQLMRQTHPKQWDFCINKLNLKEPLEYIGVNYV